MGAKEEKKFAPLTGLVGGWPQASSRGSTFCYKEKTSGEAAWICKCNDRQLDGEGRVATGFVGARVAVRGRSIGYHTLGCL